MHINRREARPQSWPGFPAVYWNIYTYVCSHIQNILLFWVLSDYINRTGRNVRSYWNPSLPIIHGLIKIGNKIVIPISIQRNINCSFLKAGCFNTGNPFFLSKALIDQFPCHPAIFRHPDIPIIGSNVNQAGFYRRFRNSNDTAIRNISLLRIGSQIMAYGIPTISAVQGFKKLICSQI